MVKTISNGSCDESIENFSAKLKTAAYVVERVVPDGISHLAKMTTGAKTMMSLSADEF